jgi:hypothetical protein
MGLVLKWDGYKASCKVFKVEPWCNWAILMQMAKSCVSN